MVLMVTLCTLKLCLVFTLSESQYICKKVFVLVFLPKVKFLSILCKQIGRF